MQKRWKCTVCGYIHEGAEPPERCPVCGAERARFVLLDEAPAVWWPELFAAFKLHPVAAHFPGGLMPTAALFLLLSAVLANSGMEAAAFWLIVLVTVLVPVSLGSGLHDWKKEFAGRRAPIFFKKLALGLTLLMLGLVAIALRYDAPGLLATSGWGRWFYLLCVGGMLGCVVFLGHYGGLLVFRRDQAVPRAGGAAGGPMANGWAARIAAQAPDAILAADAEGIIRFWNHGAERIFTVPAAAAIGRSLDLIIPENLRQRHWEGWGGVMRTGTSRYGEDQLLRVPALRGDGSRFSAEFSIVMLKDAAGRIEGVAAILRDVSEQREREKRLMDELTACRAGQTAAPN